MMHYGFALQWKTRLYLNKKALFSLIEIRWLRLDINRGFGVGVHASFCACCTRPLPLNILNTFYQLMGWHLPGCTPPCRVLSPCAPPMPWPALFALRPSTWNWFLELHCRGSAPTWGLGLAVGGGVTVHSPCETLASPLMRERAGACRSLSVNNPDRTTGGRTRFTFTAWAKS